MSACCRTNVVGLCWPQEWPAAKHQGGTRNESDFFTRRTLLHRRREDWDTAAAAMDENIVYDNVGYPIIKGRYVPCCDWMFAV